MSVLEERVASRDVARRRRREQLATSVFTTGVAVLLLGMVLVTLTGGVFPLATLVAGVVVTAVGWGLQTDP